jgi:hypothetical protein
MRGKERERSKEFQESYADSRDQESSLYCRLKSKLESKDLRQASLYTTMVES